VQNAQVPTGSAIVKLNDGEKKVAHVTDVNKVIDLAQQYKVSCQVDDVKSSDAGWLSMILPWIVIGVIMMFMFGMISRASGGGGGGNKMMNFGKSRAKMQDPESQNIRFDQVAGLQEEKEEFLRVEKLVQEKNAMCIVPIREVCQGKENLCGYGCVKNCIFRTPYINVYGNMLLESFTSFKNQDNPKNEMVMGNILEKDIYTIVKEWDESIDETKDAFQFETEKDDFWNGIPKRMSERLLEADQFCKKGEFGKAEEILDKVEKYNEALLEEREKTLDIVGNTLGEELKNWEHPFDYFKYLKENDPHMFEQLEILEQLNNPSMFQSIIKELEKCRGVLEERKKLDIPGSIFEKPIRNDFTGIVDLATRIKCMWEFAKLFKNIKMD